MGRIREVVDRHGLSLHLDGARLWNASAATGLDVRAWADLADSVSVCLSKGLGAPVGSVIAGTIPFIDRAHRFRKVFGGGMRQAGILAAAGLYALEHHRARLLKDHENARFLADFLSKLPGAIIDLEHVQTNIVVLELGPDAPFDGPGLVKAMREVGVWFTSFAPRKCRLVTHLDVSWEDVDEACKRIQRAWSV
jgi:threonine aldolase